jgi:hypothetical protein
VARTRTTKKLAQRIDLNYFKRPTPLKRAKLWISLLLPLLALAWIAWRGFSGDRRVYSSGRMSEPHAVLEKECEACHVQQAGAFSAKAADNACLGCHDGPTHHAAQIAAPNCATCHVEHRGRIRLTATSNQACAECHAHLDSVDGQSHFANHIGSFADGHPEFAALRSIGGVTASDPGTIKLNHAIHMKPIRRGPSGPDVQLQCSDCHRPAAVKSSWPYADPRYVAAPVSYTDADNFLPVRSAGLAPHDPESGRELMAPPKFATACASCHQLTFDKRFDEGVPHDKPEVIYPFLVKKFSDYIAAHPAELHEMQDPARDLAGKLLPPRMRTLTPGQWIEEHVAVAEELLARKTCIQCHQTPSSLPPGTPIYRGAPHYMTRLGPQMKMPDPPLIEVLVPPAPEIAPAKLTLRWLPHSKFSHDAHTGFSCTSCHKNALTSTESTDILIPGIETCKTCHTPGPEHAESRCFECHSYHDWSKRKEVKPHFTLPGLRTGNGGR